MIGSEVFGRTIACECGRTHRVQPDRVLYADDAVERLPELCAVAAGAGRRAAVLMDVRTAVVAGDAAVESLGAAGWRVQRGVVPDRPGGRDPVCDEPTKRTLADRLEPADLLLTVGSGVVTDLGKWLAFERGAGFVAFATAASMNGYASANVAPTLEGVKSLVRARPPSAVAASPRVLREAPYEMTAAGLGDALAKSASSADWRLNHLLFGDYYCARSVAMVARIEPLYLDHPQAVRRREDGALAALFEALLLTGAAMTMAESSAPASGGEHLLSHALDMMAHRDGRPHDLHGRQVGVGTVLASALYRRVLTVESPRTVEPPGDVDRAFWGPLAGPVAGQYAAKLPRLRQAKEAISHPAAWDRLRAELAPMLRSPEALRDCLARAGAARSAADLGIAKDRLLAAFLHAHEIRSRFTVLDLAALLGLRDAIPEIVEQWTQPVLAATRG